MDAITTFTMFDRWKAQHVGAGTPCQAARLDVNFERREVATRIVLQCPTCLNTIIGTVGDADWSEVMAYLDPRRAH